MKQNAAKKFLYSAFRPGQRKQKPRCAVILAGGDGTRLQSLTKVISGDERPKQFCQILQGETLLAATARRTAMSIEPRMTFYSLTAKHERFYKSLLSGVSENQKIVQPENKGTAPAILYSLLRLPSDSIVAFFPSDHYFSNDAAFMSRVETAFGAVEENSNSVILLGIEPEKPETAYGWIEPVETAFGLAQTISPVKRFWEKPAFETARNLLARGCLWNSFVMVGRIETFLKLFQKHLPDFYRMFAASSATFGTLSEAATVRALYDWMAETNFSTEILEKCAGGEGGDLYVLPVGAEVGWSDWGEPQRVLGTLENLGIEPHWKFAFAA